MKLATWKKPGTTDTRIYFNGLGGDVKLFAVQDADRFEIKFSASLYPSQKDALLDRIDVALEEMNNGERVILWSDLLNLVK